jgi:hypothetical protein
MIARCQVLEEEQEKYPSKYGPKTIRVWRCLDVTPAGVLVKPFDYLPTTEEQEKFTGKLKNRTINLAITEIWEGFGRRLRAKGTVVNDK